MESIIIPTHKLPSGGIYQIVVTGSDIAEPIVKPDTRPAIRPRPDSDDPFYFPAPGVDPTPKG